MKKNWKKKIPLIMNLADGDQKIEFFLMGKMCKSGLANHDL